MTSHREKSVPAVCVSPIYTGNKRRGSELIIKNHGLHGYHGWGAQDASPVFSTACRKALQQSYVTPKQKITKETKILFRQNEKPWLSSPYVIIAWYWLPGDSFYFPDLEAFSATGRLAVSDAQGVDI